MDAPAQPDSLSPEMWERITLLRFSTSRPEIVDELVAKVRTAVANNIRYENEIGRQATSIMVQNDRIVTLEQEVSHWRSACDKMLAELERERHRSIFDRVFGK
jgi:hypothetical protein